LKHYRIQTLLILLLYNISDIGSRNLYKKNLAQESMSYVQGVRFLGKQTCTLFLNKFLKRASRMSCRICGQVAMRCGAGLASCARWRTRWANVLSVHGSATRSHQPAVVSTPSAPRVSIRSCSPWDQSCEPSTVSRFVSPTHHACFRF